MNKEKILDSIGKWASEVGVKNLNWHELSLLKSFGLWLESKSAEPNMCDCIINWDLVDVEGVMVCSTCQLPREINKIGDEK